MYKCFSIARARVHPVKIPISHFDAETLINKNFIEVKFRPLPDASRELVSAAALTTEATVHALERVLKSAHEPVRRVFITRALNAVAILSELSPEGSIEAASSATSDCGVLARALVDPEAVTSIAESDPLAAAKLRGVEARENLLRAEGGTLSGDDVSKLIGISRQAVDKRRRAGRLIALTRGRRGYFYPAWQFEGGRTLPGLEEVLKALKRHDQWMQAAFMLHPNIQLNNSTPLAELRSGKLDAVVDAALSYGEHGAA
jgi:DNA-directed RNA polymerase specialized sigma24 family protein